MLWDAGWERVSIWGKSKVDRGGRGRNRWERGRKGEGGTYARACGVVGAWDGGVELSSVDDGI